MLLTGLGIFVVANLITAEAPTFAIAMASLILAGVGAAMFAPSATGDGQVKNCAEENLVRCSAPFLELPDEAASGRAA